MGLIEKKHRNLLFVIIIVYVFVGDSTVFPNGTVFHMVGSNVKLPKQIGVSQWEQSYHK